MRFPTRPPHLGSASREEIRRDFLTAWATTESLFETLHSEESFLRPPPHGLRHPLIFYYGHSAVFYINKLLIAGLIEKPLHPQLEKYFAIGVDENSWDDLGKNHGPWPALAELKAYRKEVLDTVLHVIDQSLELAPQHTFIDKTNSIWSLLMAIEHERIHIETSSVLIREMSLDLIQRPKGFAPLHPSAFRGSAQTPLRDQDFSLNSWVPIPEGVASLGKPADWPAYGWDNEYGTKTEIVPGFEVARFLISNGEFHEFVEDGGYARPAYWNEEGWAWRSYRDSKNPKFWLRSDAGSWKLRTCFEEIEMPWRWPVIVNFHEAKAFANWRGARDGSNCRLLTEAEHHHLRAHVDPAWGTRALSTAMSYEQWFGSETQTGSLLIRDANIGLRFGSESPVERDAIARNAPVCDVFGNVWQWCEDFFAPLEGFQTHPYYEDYSIPAFDGRHRMIMGGSFASTGEQATPWVRSNFRPHFFQHAGIRLIREKSS